jgi:hypothetical protein
MVRFMSIGLVGTTTDITGAWNPVDIFKNV